ncbi:MAG TPA: hypothetical protein VHI71_02110 [Actinomycetota bacterium]|nr:hypothetical protein [Actinomycetota bacterium]
MRRVRARGAALVQLTALIAAESFVGRFNRGIGLRPQGFSEGSACVVAGRIDPSG